MDFAQIILSPFVWLLTVFYNLFGSYGLALIFFAIVVKLILFPFSLKGKRSMIQMNMLSDKMQKLQKQYGKDKERYNLELQKLYEKEKVNPMSGCLWSFVPLLILFPLYAIIRQPLKYMMGVNSQDLLNAVANAVQWNSAALDMGWIKEAADSFANTGYNQLYLASLITPENLASVQAAVGEAGSKVFSINFDFLGLIDLSQTPQLKFWTISGGFGLFLLPVISAASGFVFSLISMKTNSVNQKSAQAANNATAKSMLIVSPLMSLWIGFTVPAGLSIYWIAQYFFSIFQEIICGKLLKKDYEAAQAAAAQRELEEKEEEKRRKEEARLERQRRLEEEKKNRGKKKAAKKDEDAGPAINKDDSRIGIRAYARGRAYDPNRFGGVTPYVDPSDLIAAQKAAEDEKIRSKNKKNKKKEQPEDKQAAPETAQNVQQPAPEIPAPEQEQPQSEVAPETAEVTEAVETVEKVQEQPQDEDDKKEGV